MNIYQALRLDHDKQCYLLAELTDTSGDSSRRRSIYEQLKTALTDHAAAEECHFYIPLVKKDLTQQKFRHNAAEHHEIDELLEAVDTTDMSSSAWLTHARSLEHKVLHHLKKSVKSSKWPARCLGASEQVVTDCLERQIRPLCVA